MSTGGSRGIRGSQDYVRRGGAVARMMLLQAAANEWKVPVEELTVSNGTIRHAASKRQTTYGRVAAAASKLTPPDPKSVKLKDPKYWTIAGKPMKRLDTADKLNGSKVYAIDIKLPGMLNAAIKDTPVYGGKLKSVDEAKVAKMPGVRKVVRVERQRGRRRRRHLVAGEDRARRAADHLGRGRERQGIERHHRQASRDRPHRDRDQWRAARGRRAGGDRRCGEEDRGDLFDPVPLACLHGGDERHRAAHGGQGRMLDADAEPRSLARGAVVGIGPAARRNAKSIGTISAAASAGAAAPRTTSTRRWPSPRNSPAFR